MLNFTRKPRLSEYCSKKINESIRKITEKYNLHKNIVKIKIPFKEDNENSEPEFNIYNFIIFLSISTITYILYKRIK